MRPLSVKPRWFVLLALAAALFALAAAGCGGGDSTSEEPAAEATTEAPPPATESEAAATDTGEAAEPAPEPANLKVSLDWYANPDHVALFYAQEKGMWTDQALTVELKTPSDPSAGLKLVATGKFDLAVYYQGDMFYAG